MYKVMLADNEYQDIEILRSHVDWKKHGFRVSAVARNGMDALRKIKREKPDVLITDVHMPFMDGVELSKIVHRGHPEISIIFLSGHSRFEDMKAALQVNAIDYLLKPINLHELCDLLAVAKKRCDEKRALLKLDKSIITDWIRQTYDQEGINLDISEELFQSFSRRFSNVSSLYITLITIDELSYLVSIDKNEYYTLLHYQRLFTELAGRIGGVLSAVREIKYLLITADDPAEQIRIWKRENQGLQEFVTACIYEEPVDISRIPTVLREIIEYRGWFVYRGGPGQVIYYRKSDRAAVMQNPGTLPCDLPAVLPRLLEAIRYDQVEKIHALMSGFYERSDVEDLHNQTMNLLDMLYAAPVLAPSVAELSMINKPAFFNCLLGIESIALLRIVVEQHIVALALATNNAINADIHIGLIRKMKEYMEENYAQPFSVEGMGQAVNYSPNYLRSIFRKYTGRTVLDALTDVRIRHAEKLLIHSALTVRAIAQTVGYVNPSYFCTQFFKRRGITPQQYRKGGQK